MYDEKTRFLKPGFIKHKEREREKTTVITNLIILLSNRTVER